MTRFIRVKNKVTRHELDIAVESFDPEKYVRLTRFPESSRPRPPKPHIGISEKVSRRVRKGS